MPPDGRADVDGLFRDESSSVVERGVRACSIQRGERT